MLTELLKDAKWTVVANPATAGTSAVTSGAALDMSGFDAVLYICSLGTVTDGSILTLTAYEAATNVVTGGTAVTGGATTAVTAATSSNQMILLDVIRPSLRYQYVTLTRTTQNAIVNCIIGVQYRARTLPVTQPTGAQGILASLLVNPPEN